MDIIAPLHIANIIVSFACRFIMNSLVQSENNYLDSLSRLVRSSSLPHHDFRTCQVYIIIRDHKLLKL